MKLSRRRLLMTGGIALPATYLAKGLLASPSDTKNVILVLNGIGDRTPPSLLAEILQVFIDRYLPVSCVVDFSNNASAHNSVNDIATQEPGLIEILATLPEITNEGRYFQSRAASDLRKSIVETFFANSLDSDRYPIVSTYNTQHGAAFDFTAFRSAGFRTQIEPSPTDQPTELQIVGREQLQITGGITIDLAASPWRASVLDEPLSVDGDLLISISVAKIEALDEDEVLQRCVHLAEILRTDVVRGRIFATRPVDLLLHASQQPAPSTCVLVPPPSDILNDPVAEFIGDMQANDIPFTVLSGPYTLHQDMELLNEDGIEIVLLTPEVKNSWTGLRADGRLQVSTHGSPGMSATELLPPDTIMDSAIVIYPATVNTYLQRAALIDRLSTMQREGKVRLQSIPDFTAHTLAADPIFTRFQSVRNRKASDPAQPLSLSPADRAEFMRDARLAWRFIDRFTNDSTGICAGTVQDGANFRINQDVTMWDLASQIQGITAAHALAIIPAEEAKTRLSKMLENLPTETIDGLSLPSLMFSAATIRTTNSGFDMCDTGRFFTALTSAIEANLVTAEIGHEVFSVWDLSETIRDTHPFNNINGQWSDSLQSHCAPYTRHGLADWGLDISSPYPQIDDSADQRMQLLYRAAFIGHYGAEPMLLEAIELGATPASEYLSEILFDAQLSAYERTGKLKCASETLLNFAPWFSYQGIRLDRSEAEGWVIASPNTSAAYDTDAFHISAEVISSKSAFLWVACHPHPHSNRLLRFIRDKARVEDLGFSAGVFTNTYEVMENYSDINTNGIILTAIAKILR